VPEELNVLKRKLKDATDLHKRTTDSDEKHWLGADVRELERLVAPDLPRSKH
jgi:hypothetical protein